MLVCQFAFAPLKEGSMLEITAIYSMKILCKIPEFNLVIMT